MNQTKEKISDIEGMLSEQSTKKQKTKTTANAMEKST